MMDLSHSINLYFTLHSALIAAGYSHPISVRHRTLRCGNGTVKSGEVKKTIDDNKRPTNNFPPR